MAARHPDRLIVNGRFDPRDGDAGLRQLEEDHAKYGLKGVKLYTAEWNAGSRGYKLDDPIAVPVLREVHRARHHEHPRPQGPDDLAAGQGRLRRRRRRQGRDPLPGAQLHRRARRPAADRGLLLHGDAGAQRLRRPVGRHRRADARPPAVLRQGDGRAAVLGRRGQDAVRRPTTRSGSPSGRSRGSSTGTTRTTRSRTTRRWTTRARRRSSASTPPSSTASRCPRSCSCAERRTRRRRATTRSWSRVRVTTAHDVLGALGTVYDPELDEPITALRFVTSCDVSAERRRGRPAAAADAAVRAELRLPHGGRRARRRASGCRGSGEVTRRARGPLHGARDQRRRRRGGGLRGRVPRRDRGRARRAARAVPPQGARRAPGAAVRGLLAAGATDRGVAALRLGELPDGRRRAALPRAARAARHRRRPTLRPRSCAATARRSRPASWRRWLRMAGLVRTSLEANGGICRSLLEVRYGTDPEEVAA